MPLPCTVSIGFALNFGEIRLEAWGGMVNALGASVLRKGILNLWPDEYVSNLESIRYTCMLSWTRNEELASGCAQATYRFGIGFAPVGTP